MPGQMSSKRAFSIHCPLLLIVLLTLPPLATASGHQFSLFSAVKDSHNVRRDVREADDASSSSINAEEDLGGLNTGWLTDDQLSELTSAENNEERMKKLRGFYDNLEGEAKKGATEKLIVDCYGWLDDVASEDERNALKQMHHRNHEECREKVKELLGRLGEERREQVEKRLGFCEHVWYDGKMDGEEGKSAQTGDEHHHHHGKRWIHRRRRDHQHGEHKVEDYFKTHLAWLTDDQKNELKGMKETGKSRSELKQKVIEWYDATAGDARERATELLKGGCRELIKMVLGEEKATKIKEMKESGTDVAKIGDQINAWIKEVTDEKKKELATEYRGVCAKLFGVKSSRKRRDHHHQHEHGNHEGHHKVEDYFKTHLAWLTDDQKNELKGMKETGKSRSELKQKVIEWYDATAGDARERATELLKGGCRELIKMVLGEEKATKIKEMKESGTDVAKIGDQINAWIKEVTDEKKKELATEYRGVCAKLFGVKGESGARRRRSWHGRHHNVQQKNRPKEDEGEVQLEDEDEGRTEEAYDMEGEHLSHHNSWLNRKQKQTLKRLRDRGHEDHELHERIHEFYDVSPEEVKATARGILQRGCESILKRIFGEYKAEEIIQMSDEGASNGEIEEKITESLNQIRNPQKREEAGRFSMSCRRIFTMIERRRRSAGHAEHSLEELFKSHLSWLSVHQREELKGMKGSGKGRTEMQQKVMELYGQLQGEQKTKAREHLRNGCRELLAHVVGNENANQLKQLREDGMSRTELEAKANEMVGAVQEEEKKMEAKEFGAVCKKLLLEGTENV
ncbi:hypothetical protein GPALN_005418 [Globodera pallida]|nr:hypothetical protein GPALN_005418 [Globodera pallida]